MNNIKDLDNEIMWLRSVLEIRASINAGKKENSVYDVQPPQLQESDSAYATLIKQYNFGFDERLALVLALVPHILPSALDAFISRDGKDEKHSQFGGTKRKSSNAFWPTGETVMFVLAGKNVQERALLRNLFSQEHPFALHYILSLGETERGDNFLNGTLNISQDHLDLLISGKIFKPVFSADFPAQLLSTEMEWNDLVISPNTNIQLGEIETWLNYKKDLIADSRLGKRIKPGFKALFYGPPGTGKTLAASLLGKKTGRDVYRVDLSTVVSKYIGETEKNLAKLFDRAAKKDWILFFDEADALFGKRTSVNDSHDRYANQEVSYLLQRVEYHEGLVILASNMKNNIDSAFLRRFQSIVHFPLPKAEERLRIWENSVPESLSLDKAVDLHLLSKEYELSGAHIINIISHCTLMTMADGTNTLTKETLKKGVARELAKEGRTV